MWNRIIYERNGSWTSRRENWTCSEDDRSAHALDLISFQGWIVYVLSQFFILHKARSRSQENSKRCYQGGVRRSDPIPSRLQAPIVPRDVSNLRRSYKIEESWCERSQRRSRRSVDAGRVVRRTDLLLWQHCRSVPFVSYLKFIFNKLIRIVTWLRNSDFIYFNTFRTK